MSDNHSSTHHITPASTYLGVFMALAVLTILTIVFYMLHLGPLAAPVAFLIATTKATLVMGYFMHLKYETALNKLIFALGFFFVFLLFIFCVADIFTRVKVFNTL
jgi:cytochrome c oxidase subunit 4